MKAQWRGREDFAEIAEVLGVATDQVMAQVARRGRIVVLFTNAEKFDAETPAYTAFLERGDDGILRDTEPRRQIGTLGIILPQEFL